MTKKIEQPFESTLQDLVYSLDAGTGLKIVRTGLFCIVVLVLMLIVTASQFRGLDSEASMDCAQIGRNLAQSNRYVTRCVRPLSIHQVSANRFDGDARIDFHPELIRAPGYPVLLAVCFKFYDMMGVDIFPDAEGSQEKKIYPAEQLVVIPVNHFFTLLSGLMLYLLGLKLFSHRIALLGTVTYFLSLMVWMDSLHGTGIPVLSFFVIGAVYFAVLAMVRRREQRPLWSWLVFYFLSILFSAAAFLTNYSAIAIFPGIALFVLLMGSRMQRGGHLCFFYFVLTFMLISPWLMRNYNISGQPLGLAAHTALADTASYPGDSLMRTLPEDGTNPFSLLSDFGSIREKWAANFSSLYNNHFTSLGSGLLIAFFLVTYFYRFVRVHVHNLHWGIGLSMILFLIGAGYFGEEGFRVYHIFWPFVILYGLAFFSILLDRLDISVQLYKTGLTILIVLLTAFPLIVTIFIVPPPTSNYPPYYPPFIMRVSEWLKPTEIMCSDMPWATAWYGNRTSILLPKTLEDYYRINDYRKYISGLYLTTLTKDRPFVSTLVTGSEKTWLPISMGQTPDDFPLTQGVPLNDQDQVFLTDSPRWVNDNSE